MRDADYLIVGAGSEALAVGGRVSSTGGSEAGDIMRNLLGEVMD